jgi:hypothetical protein
MTAKNTGGNIQAPPQRIAVGPESARCGFAHHRNTIARTFIVGK